MKMSDNVQMPTEIQHSRAMMSLRSFIFVALVPTLVVLLALLYFVTRLQIDIRQECQNMLWKAFPQLIEQQRTAINMERLRMLGNIVFTSTDASARRKARIEAQALTTDAAFEGSPKVRETMALAFERLKEIAAIRDNQRTLRTQLYGAFGRVAQVQDELSGYALEEPLACKVWTLTNVSTVFVELLTVQDIRTASMGDDRMQLLLAKLDSLEAGAQDCEFPPRLQDSYLRMSQQILQFSHAYKEYFTAEKKVQGVWHDFDIILRSLSDHIALSASVGIESMLQKSIEQARTVERITWQGFMLLCATALLGLFMMRNGVCVPLLGLTKAINSIRDGKGAPLSSRIFIKELQYLSDAITSLNYYWTSVQAHSVKLESEKHLLEGLSIKDGLTDLHNRRYFDLVLHTMWDEARTSKRPLALLMMDIDHFKNYNDSLGHPTGDTCLKQLATAFSTNILRPTDKVCRYGGEEFALLINCADVSGALRVAERIHHGVRRLGIEHPASAVGPLMTLSIGVACYVPEEGDEDPTILVEWADRALYAAKKAGRNRTCQCVLSRDSQGGWEEHMEVITHANTLA